MLLWVELNLLGSTTATNWLHFWSKVMPFLYGLKCFLMSYFQGLGENCSEEFSVPPTVSPVSQCVMGNNSGVASVASAACTFLLLYARNNSESIMLFQCDIENILSLCHRCLHSSLLVPLFILSPLTNQQQDFTSIVHQKVNTPAPFCTFPSHVFKTKKM